MAGLANLRFSGSEQQRASATVTPATRLRAARLHRDPQALAIVRAIARTRRLSVRVLLGRARGTAEIAVARQLAMYLVHVLLGRPQDAVGLLFGRDASTVSHACRVIENLRDNPPLETEIQKIEQRIAVAVELRRVA